FTRENYIIMLGGILLLIIGYIVMSSDKEEFGFGFMGLTLGPIIVFIAFLVPFVAIFYKKKASNRVQSEEEIRQEKPVARKKR
ncbi:MAG TPA: DUF3098 domain-containing protein, partial [Microscillaceae bacterium]|nr:DUF3098 domain-containing protein [Microscillaceae bacterium]